MTAIDRKDIHTHFGLSYANYLVLPRTLLQSMPEEWQHEFVTLLEKFGEAFSHVDQAEAYDVKTGVDRYLNEPSEAELKAIGWTVEHTEEETLYYSPTGDEVTSEDADGYHILIPTADPVPHYNRGRTYIEPRIS